MSHPDAPGETPDRPPLPETAAEFRAASEWYDARSRFHAMMAASTRKLADGYLRQAEAMESGKGPLRIITNPDTVDTMNASPISNVRRSKAAIDDAHRRHPFVAALVKKGTTVAQAARDIGRPRSTVQAWYKAAKDPGYREIPWECAEKIRELYGVPHSAWRSVGPKP